MEFNKRGSEIFRNDLRKALESVGKKHGIKIKVGYISCSSYDFRVQFQAVKKEDQVDKDKADFLKQLKYTLGQYQ